MKARNYSLNPIQKKGKPRSVLIDLLSHFTMTGAVTSTLNLLFHKLNCISSSLSHYH